MNDHHRAETNRFLYFARLQLNLATNRELQQQQQLPQLVSEQLYYRAALHFLDLAYRHYLLEIAETTQCKISAARAAPMLFAWQQDGWFSDQLSELANLETNIENTPSWLAALLSAIDAGQPMLETVRSASIASAEAVVDDADLISVAHIDNAEKTPLQELANWRSKLEKLISRQRQLNQNW